MPYRDDMARRMLLPALVASATGYPRWALREETEEVHGEDMDGDDMDGGDMDGEDMDGGDMDGGDMEDEDDEASPPIAADRAGGTG